jgi:N,N'-diacetyllegionaminate synthase|tara:strand:- start:2271 stop:3278 length:1008 start_codon:yes stop_codon:yes gene_type:complete
LKRLSTAIIAEAGVNHNGSIATAKKMIDAAAEAGADLVKFQTFKAEALVIKSAEKTEYQKEITGTDESQFEMIKKLELDRAEHEELIKYCASKSIRFLSTAFDHDSIDLLTELSVPFFKIPSGEITNLPYLRHIGRMGKPIIMSTGMATLDEVRFALKVLLGSGAEKEKITILHCNTEYPTPMEDVNLNAMLTIQDELEIAVGYSDHTLGIEVSVAAVALGATVIEKHFTLDRTLSGPDHAASLEPHELKAMVTAIRNIEKAKGDGVKRPSKSETKNIPIARKSIVAKKTIIKGEAFSESNLAVKRPGTGISPMEWDAYMDKSADREYQKDDLIQ